MPQARRPRFFVFVAMSLDGYIAGSRGELGWLDCVAMPGTDYGFAEFMSSVDTLLLGRNTYDVVVEFPEWPYAGKQCFIVTHRSAEPRHGEQFLSGAADCIVQALEQAGAKRVYVDGGQLIQQWLDRGLVDALTISVVPLLLGQGIRLFSGGFQQQSLKLKSVVPYDSGLVQLRYEQVVSSESGELPEQRSL